MSDKRYPLQWPAGWPRARHRQTAQFGKIGAGGTKAQASAADAFGRLQRELDLIGARHPILSTNLELRLDGIPKSNQWTSDPGAAVYFNLKGADVALACDKWDRVPDNIIALAKHLEAMRGMERWGVGNLAQAFRGYEALPAPEQWWQVLGLPEHASTAAITDAYRRLAPAAHPDRGGSHAAMARLNAARDAGLRSAQG